MTTDVCPCGHTRGQHRGGGRCGAKDAVGDGFRLCHCPVFGQLQVFALPVFVVEATPAPAAPLWLVAFAYIKTHSMAVGSKCFELKTVEATDRGRARLKEAADGLVTHPGWNPTYADIEKALTVWVAGRLIEGDEDFRLKDRSDPPR